MSTKPNQSNSKIPTNSKAEAKVDNGKPTGGKAAVPAVVLHQVDVTDFKQNMRRMGPASLMSVGFHIVLLGLFWLLAPKGLADGPSESKDDTPVATESADDVKKDPFLTTDIDPAATEFDTD